MSAGTRTFKVLFHYDDPSGGRATATITVHCVRDGDHAKHVLRVKHANKYANMNIVRATEVKRPDHAVN